MVRKPACSPGFQSITSIQGIFTAFYASRDSGPRGVVPVGYKVPDNALGALLPWCRGRGSAVTPLDHDAVADRLDRIDNDRGTRSDPDLPVDRARRASIRRVAERLHLGVPEKQGRECVVECPFHADEHPSLRLNESDGLWYCFPCGEGGDTIELVQRVRRVGFKRAVKWIARRTRPRGR